MKNIEWNCILGDKYTNILISRSCITKLIIIIQVIIEEEQVATKRAAEAAVIKQDCEKALAQVTPYLRESEQALKALKKEDVYLFSLFSISLFSFFSIFFFVF